ncbi:MAG: ATP-dependent DNA helicase RecQ [Proteobacteria bacterium]|nr:ATP-dependent DNA helicase RecQ [Pseudomonadota bacterium]MCP4921376.1 ATP-dependent DNA helicase RecQ [Pseudomonadota bacterium]
MDIQHLLTDRFGLERFRPGQEEVVQHLFDGDDALIVMPTGAGKSLCFQAPAVALGGTTLVVSPLIALMKDQVDGLVERGIRATCINSSLSVGERNERMRLLHEGHWELVYVAPERFTPRFLAEIKGCDIRMLAIDEAHCLSQWGHDFRPDYLRLGKVREALGHPITVAATATATPRVQDDIVKTLGLDQPRRFIRGFDRENLLLEVVACGGVNDKAALLPDLVRGSTALVYCATRKNVERATRALREAGVPAERYHAGMEPADRSRVQDGFKAGSIPVVVATNAFGMGVDKSDVRVVAHWDVPGTVEAYYQEIGRAGRDGLPSRIVLLYNEQDRRTQEFFIKMGHPPVEHVRAVYSRLLQERTNPAYIRREELGAALPDDAGGDRTASSCIYVLEREGWVRRIHPAERPGRVVLRTDAPSTPPGGLRGRVHKVVSERLAEFPGDALVLRVDRLAHDLDIERDQLTAALRGLQERNYLAWRPAERIGGVELLRPGEALTLDEARLRTRRRQEFEKLDRMLDYATAPCRRRYLLEYFGESPPWDRCGSCDGCREGKELSLGPRALAPDEETLVRKVLACVARMGAKRTGQGFSSGLISKVLTGSKDRTVLAFKFDRLSTYGLLPQLQVSDVELLIGALTRAGALQKDHVTRTIGQRETTYAEYTLTDLGRRVMFQKEPEFVMTWPKVTLRKRPRPPPKRPGQARVASDLLVYLQEIRRKLASAADLPAYVVAPNRTLEDMATVRPTTRRAMLTVHGMGPVRFGRYGAPFLDAIRSWQGT